MSQLNTSTVPLRSVLRLVFVSTRFPGKKVHCMDSFLKNSIVLEHNMKRLEVMRTQKDNLVFLFIQFSATLLPSNKSAN